MSDENERPQIKALRILAEMDPVQEWEFSQRLAVTSLALSALQMYDQIRDQEESDGNPSKANGGTIDRR